MAVVKPWLPPLAYGLLVLMSSDQLMVAYCCSPIFTCALGLVGSTTMSTGEFVNMSVTLLLSPAHADAGTLLTVSKAVNACWVVEATIVTGGGSRSDW